MKKPAAQTQFKQKATLYLFNLIPRLTEQRKSDERSYELQNVLRVI